MCLLNPNIGGAPSFANSNPQRNNTPTPSSPHFSSLILSSSISRSNISYFPNTPQVTSLRGSPAVLHRGLEQDHTGPLGSTGGAWIPTGFQQLPSPTQTQTYPTGPSKGSNTGYGGGNPVTAGETGNSSPDTPPFSRVLQQCVCGTEEGWGLEAHNQFEGAEQIQLEISPLQLEGGVLPVQNPPFRPHFSPVCVYQTPPSNCCTVQTGRSENSRLPGRLATNGIRSGFTERPILNLTVTGPVYRVSGLHNRLQEDDPGLACSQGRQDTQGVLTHFEPFSEVTCRQLAS